MSYGRPSQSKAQNEANARTLRALVKNPDNKVCADCKRNDPRWASWNIGCFLCIRCSGIHRSMGTHISKVKSIDLDIWTPEQMESVQKWGNKRCNLYWEAHLKSGHSPPEHKVESFIRSKYESRRWAKDGPPPSDPSVLDSSPAAPAAQTATSSRSPAAKPVAAQPKVSNPIDLLSEPTLAPAVSSTTSKGASINLLDDPPISGSAAANKPSPAPPATATVTTAASAAPKKASGGGGGLFDLDWHEPAPAPSATSPTLPSGGASGAKGKNDIMSLFSSSSSKPSAPGFGEFGGFSSGGGGGASLTSGFSSLEIGGGGGGGGGRPANGSATASNPWATTTATQTGVGSGIFNTQDVWGNSSSGTATSTLSNQPPPSQKKDDAFADIWGDFK